MDNSSATPAQVQQSSDRVDSTPTQIQTDNEQLFQEAQNPGFLEDFWDFLKTSRKWWMLPVLVVLLLLGVILVMANTAVAPFIYTLF